MSYLAENYHEIVNNKHQKDNWVSQTHLYADLLLNIFLSLKINGYPLLINFGIFRSFSRPVRLQSFSHTMTDYCKKIIL